jgi:hypothetical protein
MIMPMTINVGLSKKVGLPDYGSVGATCNVTFEADHNLLDRDLEGFHQRVKNGFIACKQAVQDQLSRELNTPASNGNGATNGHAPANNGHTNGHHNGNGNGRAAPRRSNARKATASQARALRSIADRRGLDLAADLQSRFGVNDPEELSITEASRLIDELKSATNGHGTGR